MNTTRSALSIDDAAALAHDYAEKFAALRGVPAFADMPETARRAAEIGGLTGRAAEVFYDRTVGHWMNLAAGTPGV